ncbi:hypothetical protein OIU78_006642 [Salix suchowensis]|nr:hypothetical protein OIU78_006642 [Salix suchowensis]
MFDYITPKKQYNSMLTVTPIKNKMKFHHKFCLKIVIRSVDYSSSKCRMLSGPDVVYKSHWYEMIICRIFIQIPSRQAFRTVVCLVRAGFCSA